MRENAERIARGSHVENHLNDNMDWIGKRILINCVLLIFLTHSLDWTGLNWLRFSLACQRKLTFKPIVQFISRSHNTIHHKFIINIFSVWLGLASRISYRLRTICVCVIHNTVDTMSNRLNTIRLRRENDTFSVWNASELKMPSQIPTQLNSTNHNHNRKQYVYLIINCVRNH